MIELWLANLNILAKLDYCAVTILDKFNYFIKVRLFVTVVDKFNYFIKVYYYDETIIREFKYFIKVRLLCYNYCWQI
jgi:hypothetical protein